MESGARGMSGVSSGACLGHHLGHIVNNGQQSAVLHASVMPFFVVVIILSRTTRVERRRVEADWLLNHLEIFCLGREKNLKVILKWKILQSYFTSHFC